MHLRHGHPVVALACALLVTIVAGSAAGGEYEVCVDVTADVRALDNEDAFVWEPARDRLSALGPAAFPSLLRALEHEGPAIREAIIGILADSATSDEAVRSGVARAARNDAEADVRAVAVPAIRKLAGRDSRDLVVAALDDPSPVVRRKAITACTALCSDDAALTRLVTLATGDEPNALQAKRVLWSLTDEGRNASVVATVRAQALAASRTGADTASGVVSEERRTALAALLLAELGDDSQLDVIARATGPEQRIEVRLHAIHALGRLGGADRVALLAALQQEPATAIYAHDALRRMAERGVDGAGDAAASHTGPHAPQLLPRP